MPTLAAIKDEAADPLKRAPQILSGTSLADFSGGGCHSQAFEMSGRILAFDSLPGANQYVLTVRGVFHEDTLLRRSGNGAPKIIESAQKQVIRESFHRYLDPNRHA